MQLTGMNPSSVSTTCGQDTDVFFHSPLPPFVSIVFMCESDVALNSPSVKISQRRIPYDHTSLRVVYKLWKMLSGAIHFNGRKVWRKEQSSKRCQQSSKTWIHSFIDSFKCGSLALRVGFRLCHTSVHLRSLLRCSWSRA